MTARQARVQQRRAQMTSYDEVEKEYAKVAMSDRRRPTVFVFVTRDQDRPAAMLPARLRKVAWVCDHAQHAELLGPTLAVLRAFAWVEEEVRDPTPELTALLTTTLMSRSKPWELAHATPAPVSIVAPAAASDVSRAATAPPQSSLKPTLPSPQCRTLCTLRRHRPW
eukprot:m.47577 g.47577  ORF g.47577 m.47577 type:complete len:167 (+) comp5987_c0_seq3:997-1497(+)